jgi:hypothetical protein
MRSSDRGKRLPSEVPATLWDDWHSSGDAGVPALGRPGDSLDDFHSFEITKGKNAMPKFQKGQSGNPGGRPKIVGEVQELARQHRDSAIETLAAIMQDKKAPAAARALASNSILDRAYGRPPQTLNANVATRPVREMSDAELMAIAASEPHTTQTEH